MQKTHSVSANSESVSLADLDRYGQGWLLDAEVRQFSRSTIGLRKMVLDKLLWFVRHKEIQDVGKLELRQFLAYFNTAHQQLGGRWGMERLTKAVRPRTVQIYHTNLKTLFRFMVEEGLIQSSPMDGLKTPVSRPDQIQPFSDKHIEQFLVAAHKSTHPRRDEAIVLFLLDTGVRASEICELRRQDVDMQGNRAVVRGKGDKHRDVYFGPSTKKAMWNYLKEEPREPQDPLFTSDRGTGAGAALTRNGLLQLVRRLGRAAAVEAIRCSPHSFRHTFAISYLRAGGDVFTLQRLLGHTSIEMTQKYVSLAANDMATQHRMHSPVERLKRRK